jgi:D-aminoacyl-tRNA deacylase
MRIVIQRVNNASVNVENKEVSTITKGLLLFIGFNKEDTIKEFDYMIDKVINMRIFDDEAGIMNKSVIDIDGEILSVSQFTLYADPSKGRRPSYDQAMKSDEAKSLYEKFNYELQLKYPKVKTGIFQAEMKINLENDGPVTIILESRNYDKK